MARASDSALVQRCATAHPSCCSGSTIPARLTIAARLGKMLATVGGQAIMSLRVRQNVPVSGRLLSGLVSGLTSFRPLEHVHA